MPKLIVQFQGQEWTVELREGSNIVGRSAKAEVPVRDPSMSREHAEVRREGDTCTIVDKGSMNGTLLNGTKVAEQKLVPGDKLQIGNAVFWFEEKKGDAAPPPAVPMATPDPGAPTRIPAPAVEVPRAQPSPSTKRSEPKASALVKDFAQFGKDGGGLNPAVLAAIVVVVLGTAGWFGFRALSKGPEGDVDKDNLVGYNGSFELASDKGVIGWTLRTPGASKLSTIDNVAKDGARSMGLEKAGGPSDLVVEIASNDAFELQKSSQVEIGAWVKAESYTGLVALRITWLSKVGGAVILEEISEPSPRGAEWQSVQKTFAAPAGAGAFVPGFLAVGRGGRIYIDDVKVKRREGAPSDRSLDLGSFQVSAASTGSFNVQQGGKRVLSGAQVCLWSEKDGALSQAVAAESRCDVDAAKKTLTAGGKLFSPVDLRTVDFEQEVKGSTSLLVGYTVKGDILKQVDRVGLQVFVPRGEIVGDVSRPVSRATLRGEAGDFTVEVVSGQLATVSVESLPGGRRILFGIPVERGASEVVAAFEVKAGVSTSADPKVNAQKSEQEGRMADARQWWRQLVDTTKEPEKQEQFRLETRRLDQLETTEWNGVLSAGFRAGLMRHRALFEKALQLLDSHEKRWPGGRYAAAAKSERERLSQAVGGAAADRDSERARRLLQEARDCLDTGRKTLAREILRTIREVYPASDAAGPAAELLKQVKAD